MGYKKYINKLSNPGIVSTEDTKRTNKHPLLNEEMNSIHTLGKFVEQEQLIQDYEKLIKEWIQNQ